jgi:hypothetical protein
LFINVALCGSSQAYTYPTGLHVGLRIASHDRHTAAWTTDLQAHRAKGEINELKNYFNGVIDWVSSVFKDVEKEMQGLEWGRLYEQYHSKSYDPAKVSAEVKRLYADPYVKNRRGVFEYILGGLQDSKLLDVRVFDEATKKSVYRLGIPE